MNHASQQDNVIDRSDDYSTTGQKILDYLQRGGRLTSTMAKKPPFSCSNLQAVNWSLRKLGYVILDELTTDAETGRKVKAYFMSPAAVEPLDTSQPSEPVAAVPEPEVDEPDVLEEDEEESEEPLPEDEEDEEEEPAVHTEVDDDEEVEDVSLAYETRIVREPVEPVLPVTEALVVIGTRLTPQGLELEVLPEGGGEPRRYRLTAEQVRYLAASVSGAALVGAVL